LKGEDDVLIYPLVWLFVVVCGVCVCFSIADPTWSPLKAETSICLMEQLIAFVRNDLFLDNALAWMDVGIDEGLALPRDMVNDLLDVLHELSSSHSEHGINAAEIHAKLSKSFQKALSFEQLGSD
jgi:hypothetical protein